MHYYEWNIADWRKSTRGLSFLEKGIYREMIDELCDTEVPLPLDEEKLLDQLGVSKASDVAAVRRIVEKKFRVLDGGLIQPRAWAVVLNWKAKQDHLAGIGKLGGLANAKRALAKRLAAAKLPPSVDDPALSGAGNHQPEAKNHEPEARSDEPAVPGSDEPVTVPPALEVALRWAENFSKGNAWGMEIGPEVVREWHDDRSRTGWEIPRGQHLVPIVDWQADLRDFTKWKGGQGGGAAKKEGGGKFVKPERAEVAAKLRTHADLPEPPCEWRKVLRELYPAEEYPALVCETVVWGLMEPDVRREVECECRKRGLLSVDWRQPGVPAKKEGGGVS